MDAFIEFLQKAGTFRCENIHDERLLDIGVGHIVGQAADKNLLAHLKKIMNGQDQGQLEPFYSIHNGSLLFSQPNTENAGILLVPIEMMEEINRNWREWFSGVDEAELYDFQRRGVAFGGPQASGNYFVYCDGKIYYWNHDGGNDAVLAHSLEELFDKIMSQPATFLYDLGCYTRYSDGKTNIQWIPKEYLLS